MTEISFVKQRITAARSLTVLSGAGISAESGVPTFRGPGGLWKNHRAEELATPEAFQRDPILVWSWYQWRRKLLSTKAPNPAHTALVSLESAVEHFTLITQNVDGLHQSAGSRTVITLHGDIWKVRCTGCDRVFEETSLNLPALPRCPVCERLLRPHIVWFGEEIDAKKLSLAIDACHSCEVMLVIGTSAIVQPAASFASLAKEAGALIVEINPNPALHDCADVSLTGTAAEIVPQLL